MPGLPTEQWKVWDQIEVDSQWNPNTRYVSLVARTYRIGMIAILILGRSFRITHRQPQPLVELIQMVPNWKMDRMEFTNPLNTALATKISHAATRESQAN